MAPDFAPDPVRGEERYLVQGHATAWQGLSIRAKSRTGPGSVSPLPGSAQVCFLSIVHCQLPSLLLLPLKESPPWKGGGQGEPGVALGSHSDSAANPGSSHLSRRGWQTSMWGLAPGSSRSPPAMPTPGAGLDRKEDFPGRWSHRIVHPALLLELLERTSGITGLECPPPCTSPRATACSEALPGHTAGRWGLRQRTGGSSSQAAHSPQPSVFPKTPTDCSPHLAFPEPVSLGSPCPE